MQKSSETKIRKLPLPLQVKLGTDGTLTDGLFTLTEKEASKISIISVDGDGYVSLEIHPPTQELKTKTRQNDLKVFFGHGTKIGLEASRSRGQGKDFGQYVYYRSPDSSYVAEIRGTARDRTFHLGNLKDHSSIIFQFAATIVHTFGTMEFSKHDLTPLLPRTLRYGQTMKSVLDIMVIEQYLERREGKSDGKPGRIREWFKGTGKLSQLVVTIPVQA
jgi:hypothetical protein